MSTCPLCDGSGESPIESLIGDPPSIPRRCPVCLGKGEIEEAHGTTKGAEVTGLVTLIKLKDMDDKLDDIMDKCNDIFEKVSE